jgi:hypothetical protein
MVMFDANFFSAYKIFKWGGGGEGGRSQPKYIFPRSIFIMPTWRLRISIKIGKENKL